MALSVPEQSLTAEVSIPGPDGVAGSALPGRTSGPQVGEHLGAETPDVLQRSVLVSAAFDHEDHVPDAGAAGGAGQPVAAPLG